VPPDNITARIIALSRERYAQDRETVEQLVRKNAGLGIDQVPQAPPAQPLKPQAQAKVNKLDEIAAQDARNQPIKLGNLIKKAMDESKSAPEPPPMATETTPAKKRRRGKRGGKKNRPLMQAGQSAPATQPASSAEHEEVIHLR
jgi:hypothetical protein